MPCVYPLDKHVAHWSIYIFIFDGWQIIGLQINLKWREIFISSKFCNLRADSNKNTWARERIHFRMLKVLREPDGWQIWSIFASIFIKTKYVVLYSAASYNKWIHITLAGLWPSKIKQNRRKSQFECPFCREWMTFFNKFLQQNCDDWKLFKFIGWIESF